MEKEFLTAFKMNDRGKEMHRRNITECKTSTNQVSKAKLFDLPSKKSITRDVSNQLFDKIKGAKAFDKTEYRSQSVLQWGESSE